MKKQRNFLEKYYKLLFLIFLIGFISIVNLYKSTVIKHTFNYSEVKEAFALKKYKPGFLFKKTSSLSKIDDCQMLTAFKELCNISITVKTTKSNHQKKLKPIIQTWFSHLASKVNFFII